ncbi:MAG: hypothetical protein K2N58_03700 [Treponemataceae bacterium]|nr:hypothetical protein [Treponemataceae bacterium]
MAKTQGFFAKLLSSFFGSNDSDAEKKRKIKAIAKNLSKSKYHFFKNDEAQPALAKFLYDIYKAIFPAKAMFMAQDNPNRLKTMIVNYSLTEQQHAVIDALSEEAIKELMKKSSVDKIRAQIQQNIESLLQFFSPEKIAKIEALYKKMVMFRSFCTYDFYFLLKKFDASLREGEFNAPPRFDKINADYIGDELKDFIAVAYVFPEKEDWSDLVKFFKDTKGSEPVTLNVWNKIVNRINSVKNSRVLEMMIQVATKDPNYFPDYSFTEELIVDDYIDKIRGDAQKTLDSLVTAMQNNKIDGLLNQIFGTTQVDRLANYTAVNSAIYERKNLGSFEYVNELNYYKAFLLDFVKKDVREFSDLVLVRGTWSTQALSTPMSNAYHALIDSSETLLAFDAKIAENAEIGVKLKNHMPSVDRGKEARNIVGTILADLNEEAKKLCVDGTKNLIVIAKTTKTLLEDYAKPNGEVIINWKELDRFSDHPIKELGVEIYKSIYLFVNLMQSCLGGATS